MIEIGLHGVKKYLDSTLVLENIDFDIYDGEKVGIVGANGSGKTTILKLIAGIHTIDTDDKGYISMSGSPKVAYLEQIPVYPDSVRVGDVLDLAFEEINILERDMRELEQRMQKHTGADLEKILKKYSELLQKSEAMGIYDREEK